ncbi:MAG: ATP-binding protein [Gemmatimonadales bacterium]
MTAPLRLTLRRTRTDAVQSPDAVELRMQSQVTDVEAAVELVARHCFAGQQPCSRTTFRLRVALAEALSNAILRGNREDPSKQVWVLAELYPEVVRIAVRDEGDGFDPDGEPPAPEALEAESGRGLFIIRNLADRVEFNERGNTIWMTLPRC